MNTTTDDLIVKTRESLDKLSDKVLENYENVLVIGPIWLMKLVKKMFQNRKFTYGLQNLCGAPAESKSAVGRLVRIWLEDLN